MRNVQLMLLGSALVVATGGINLVACSSSGGGAGTSTGGGDASAPDTSGGDASVPDTSSGNADASTIDADSGDSSDAEAGSECGKSPSLHQANPGDISCGSDTTLVCSTGQQCCVGGNVGGQAQPQKCATWGSACDNPVGGGLAVECAQTSDCKANGANTMCCLIGSKAQWNSACGYWEATSGSGTSCQASCGAADTQVCSSDADCPLGRSCKAGNWKILQIGFCE